MMSAICEPAATLSCETMEPAELNQPVSCQLVRGQVEGVVDRVAALVLKYNVTLDLGGVERIDAAGIAGLVALYQRAQSAGHSFRVTNVPERVAEILSMVGLERFLISRNVVRNSQCDCREQRPAA
jgi:anti-anti-sigma factor